MKRKQGIYEKYIKRGMDFILSLGALIILSPVILMLAIVGAIAMGGNPFFMQKRPGKDEKIFRLLKFRTMTNKKGKDGKLLPDDQRMTAYGKFLRSTSLDELPQLLNIIKGDMAIVGPRALLIEYLPYYSEKERLRHTVRPGLTNLVSVKGRNSVSVADKFKYDIYYVNHLSFKLDLYILINTVLVVLKHEGVGLEASGKYIDYFNEKKSRLENGGK